MRRQNVAMRRQKSKKGVNEEANESMRRQMGQKGVNE